MVDFGILPQEESLLDDNDSVMSKDDKDTSFSENNISMLDYN